ncbi:AAA family ATPase [Streptomyces sp. NPDC058874]|uniref:AAA family ATPase n=1 Tax=unclassified Streptomyces TaxID=2593676 RepID=UPI0036AA184C
MSTPIAPQHSAERQPGVQQAGHRTGSGRSQERTAACPSCTRGTSGPAHDGRHATDHIHPRGVVDLRGHAESDITLSYPGNALVVVAGLPGSGKSTLLRAWSSAATVVDPRATRTAYEALTPSWLPYAVCRPWARLRHMGWMRTEIRRTHPLLIHDCGSRAWMRRWLAHHAHRAGRPLHMVVLDVGPQEALSGQRARRRLTSRRVFATHRRGLARLLAGVEQGGLPPSLGLDSMVLLDRTSRERAARAQFGGKSTGAG